MHSTFISMTNEETILYSWSVILIEKVSFLRKNGFLSIMKTFPYVRGIKQYLFLFLVDTVNGLITIIIYTMWFNGHQYLNRKRGEYE